MLRAGLISLALCSALFIAVCNCAAFSNEVQAELRDIDQAETFEENGVTSDYLATWAELFESLLTLIHD